VTLPWIFENSPRCGAARAAPILLMSYLNPLLAWARRAAARAAAAGVAGFIVPDLPFEESDDLAGARRRAGAGADGDAGDAARAPGHAVPGGARDSSMRSP
jgi:tryptophan synthase alpha chain